ncbi:hypothetical protein FRC01_005506 [Tulasnella sp. 417]|nr:hypothetical protein FRC01_005506 [Tulasnella sp. 417]
MPHRIWPAGRFPPPWFHSVRKYGDMPVPSISPDSFKVTSSAKSVPGVMYRFYQVSVQDGFQGTFEEFSKGNRFHIYERAVKLGKFKGTFDAWRYEVTLRKPGNCAYISTLRLPKVSQIGQLAAVTRRESAMVIRRPVLLDGQAVGNATIFINRKYKALPGTLLRMYYDPENHLLRFQAQDGEPLPKYTDIDLISKATSQGYRPLLVLAHAEGLIPSVLDGYLSSFDFRTNIKSGYYLRANRNCTTPTPSYYETISLPGTLGNMGIVFKLSEPENFEHLRFFPYIHEDQTLRFWDVERGVDAPLKTKNGIGQWEPEYVKKRFPRLFDHAKRLGYWNEF